MRRCFKEFSPFSQNTSQQWRISTPRTSRSETPPWRWTSWTRPGTTSSPWWGGSPSAQVQIYTFIDLFLWSGRNGGEKILDNDWLIMPQYSQREFCQYVKRDQEMWRRARLPLGLLRHVSRLSEDDPHQAGGNQVSEERLQGKWNCISLTQKNENHLIRSKKNFLLYITLHLFYTVTPRQDVPIILAGNKTDLADLQREIYVEDVRDWLDQDFKQNKWADSGERPGERKENTWLCVVLRSPGL